jgi:Ca2+-binding EF-hand superfamily protein
VAEQKLGIPRLLDVQDVANRSKPDEKSIVAYVSQFFKLFAKAQKNDALVKSIKNAVEVTKRHDAWLSKYDELSNGIMAWVSSSQAKMTAPLAARSTDGVKKEFDAYTSYMRSEKPTKQAEKSEAEGIATQLTNSKRNNKRPEFNPKITPEAMDSAWDTLASAESTREKTLMDAYSRFKQVDNDSGIFMSRCGAVEAWIKERNEVFSKGISPTASLTQIENEIDNHASFTSRYKQYQSVVEQLVKLEQQIKTTSKGQHDAEAAVSKKLAEIQSLMKSLEGTGKTYLTTLQTAQAAEKAAVEAERSLAAMFDALDFDLDQLEVRTKEPISVSSAAEVEAANKALSITRTELTTAKGKVDGEISTLTGKIASRRPQYASQLESEKSRCKSLEDALKNREALLREKLSEETARDGVRDRFAQAANGLAKNLDACNKDLKDTSGSLEQQLARVRKLRDRVNNPVKAELDQVDEIAKECDKHQIVSNSKTPHTIFTLRASYDQLGKAVDESEQSINAQIMAKQALEITPEQLREIQEVFKFFDNDNSGFVELKELKEACTAAGIDLAEDEIEHKMAARQPSMKFNIDDFTAFMVGEMKTGDDLEHVLTAFKGLTDGSETITDQQLDSAFQTDQDLNKYVRERIKNGNFAQFTTDLFSR